MKTLLLTLLLVPMISFGQNKIYFEGTYIDDAMYDGMHALEVKVTAGDLGGKTEYFYITYSDIDDEVIDYDNKLEGYSYSDIVNKKVSGYVIKSRAKYEDMDIGGVKTKEGIYRLSEIHLIN